MFDKTPEAQVRAILEKLGDALVASDIEATVQLFLDKCYWRDLVAFTWNLKTMEGRGEIKGMLQAQLHSIKPTNWQLAADDPVQENDGVVEAWMTFETAVARGQGLIRLKDGLIWTLLTAMAELKGYEENLGPTRPFGAKHGHDFGTKSWAEERAEEIRDLVYDTQPYVVVIGGGQGGIALGARLRQLKVPTIIVEKNDQPGDSWRKRYKSLCLHDPVWSDHLPYIEFPRNWPVFSPKDKMADWLEMYTKVMELNYWTRSMVRSARWDDTVGAWNVTVGRDGQEIVLRPKQLVFATGISGKPNIPDFPGQETFRGEQHHSSRHPGPDNYGCKKVVVIGSNNSAHDICAALYEAGVDVTMIQRSTTHIVRSEPIMRYGLARSLPSTYAGSGATRQSTTPGITCRCCPASRARCGMALRSRTGRCRQRSSGFAAASAAMSMATARWSAFSRR